MNKEKIKKYLLDFNERKFLNIKNREISLKESAKIQTIIGARRTGKTYLLYNKILELEKSGVSRKRIVYLNFENPILDDVSYKEIREIIELHWSIFPEISRQKLYLFIDEPQNIPKWESAVREIDDNLNANIFITGSSSRLLSREIATSLRGRSITTVLLPLSFTEYLNFNDFKYNKNRISSANKAYLLNFFDHYLRLGAYPEVVMSNSDEERLKILKDYLDLTIYKDIIDRYTIKNSRLIKTLIDLAISSCSKEFSINKHYLDLKSRSVKLGKNTMYEYLSVLEDSFFLFPLKRFSYSKKTENLSIPKIYLGDVGFLNLYFMENFGQRLENIIHLELSRRREKDPLFNINYWKSDRGQEVDFVLSRGHKTEWAAQVSYEIEDQKTRARELNSLLACLNEFKLGTGLIITRDSEEKLNIAGKTIKIIPAWKWLIAGMGQF